MSEFRASGNIRCSIDLDRLSSWVEDLSTRATGCYQEPLRLSSSMHTSRQVLDVFLMGDGRSATTLQWIEGRSRRDRDATKVKQLEQL